MSVLLKAIGAKLRANPHMTIEYDATLNTLNLILADIDDIKEILAPNEGRRDGCHDNRKKTQSMSVTKNFSPDHRRDWQPIKRT